MTNKAKDRITPLLLIPPIEYDFEEKRLKKTVQKHIEPFGGRYKAKWGKRKSLIDIHSSLEAEKMDDGVHVMQHIFTELRSNESNAIPVVGLSRSMDLKENIKDIISIDKKGLCLRVRLVELMTPGFKDDVRNLCAHMEVELSSIDLILDLEEPENFEPYSIFAKVILNAIKNIENLDGYRSFIVAGMSLKLSEIKKPGQELARHEWQLYKLLISESDGLRRPSYGDYSIETPKFLNLDMRMLKPAGKIVYTCDDTWLIPKGVSFRGNENQMVGHCEKIVNSGKYSGSYFSHGDKRIDATLSGSAGCGNLSTWKQVGVNHHLEKVVDQLSSFHAP